MIIFSSVSVVARGAPGADCAPILQDISLELTQRRIAIIGANGSGKSTLLKAVNGLVSPDEGRVEVAGIDVAKRPDDVRAMVGYIFTDPLAQLVMSTPLDDIELSLRPLIKAKHERRSRAYLLLEERGIASLANRSIYDLSGGERQLVSLTSVLAVEPSIILADEPTTLLDLRNKHLLHEAFDALSQQLIISTHDLDLAARADRVLLIDRGRICADGTPAEVIATYTAMMT